MGRPTTQALEKEERKPEVRASPESASPAPGEMGPAGAGAPRARTPCLLSLWGGVGDRARVRPTAGVASHGTTSVVTATCSNVCWSPGNVALSSPRAMSC